jgi:hypothetical protein
VTEADVMTTLAALPRGDRPFSLDSLEVEMAVSMSLALAGELCVAFDRIRRLEDAVARLEGGEAEAFRAREADPKEAAERQAEAEAMMARVLRLVLDARPAKPRPSLPTSAPAAT